MQRASPPASPPTLASPTPTPSRRSPLPHPGLSTTRSSPTSSRAPSPSRTSPTITFTPAGRTTTPTKRHAARPPARRGTEPPTGSGAGAGGGGRAGAASESYYLASASGSQTDTGGGGYGGRGWGYSTSSESTDSDDDRSEGGALLRTGVFSGGEGDGGFFGGGGGRRASAGLGLGWAGERGRGEHVLVEKRSVSPSKGLGLRSGRGFAGGFRRASSAGGEGAKGAGGGGTAGGGGAGQQDQPPQRSWASALLDTLDGRSYGHHHHHHHHHASSKDRRRPSSPSLRHQPSAFSSSSHRGHRSSPRPRHHHHTGRTSPDAPPRAPSPPPLTLDSIRSTSYNPFPLFHIRRSLLFEVTILVTPLLFALYRVRFCMPPTPVFPSPPTLPTELLLLFTLSIPFLALFRRADPASAFMPPFTDERGFRPLAQADDGVAAALVLPLLLSVAVWWDTYARADGEGRGVGLEGLKSLVHVWEANGIHALPVPSSFPPSSSSASEAVAGATAALQTPLSAARALFAARHALVLLTALNALVLLLHLFLARTVLRIERLPKSNAKRFFGFMALAAGVSGCVGVGVGVVNYVSPSPLPLSPLESLASSFLQQSSFYIVSRLARRGFTLGELNTMTSAGNALCLEFWRLSRARWYYKRHHPSIPPTFRAPTPVVAFQAVLIPGAFLSGFLLSPLLVLSRNIASRPSHRLKWPTERSRHRRLLALGVLIGLCTITLFFLGGWTSWILSSSHTLRHPWVWALKFLWFGDSDGVDNWPNRAVGGRGEWWRSGRERGRGWRRLLLVGYWATVISSAIGGWQTHLVRARRIRLRSSAAAEGSGKGGSSSAATGGKDGASLPSPSASTTNGTVNGADTLTVGGEKHSPATSTANSPVASTFAAAAKEALNSVGSSVHSSVSSVGGAGGMGGMGSGGAGGQGGADLHRVGAETARAEKAVHASLNLRRKFFHALAVVMFVPGIAVDPAFTSLSFSLAFTLFTFAEYARFFALYPIGAPLHIFFTEFVDNKDSGPVILSHFYLLTGCAGGLWLEGSGINRFTGVLVLGIGDSLASIVGKLFGRTRWPGTSKTVEGTLAFIVSVVFSAWFFRLIGIVESFSLPRYVLATTLAGLLEASSAQNDNLVIPIYMWSVVSLLSV
ncbi:hypothetical protein JCM6882_004632 [Rhodosporidiobolus microsporus]